MIKGLYSAASGMVAMQRRQDILANNVANVSTPGFKRQEPVIFGFKEVLFEKARSPFRYNAENAPGGGVKLLESFPDVKAGVMRQTENQLHMALQGPGFFVIDTHRGERYTRNGEFTIDIDGHLATHDGFKVQSDADGPISVQGSVINVNQEGDVIVDGSPAGRLRLVEFEEPTRLLREGSNLFKASDEVARKMAAAGETLVQHGHLELSNVSLPQEMTQMIMGLRAYEANQRVIQAVDSTLGRLIDQVAAPTG